MSKIRLSKTKYCNGVQCPKMLWLQNNKPEVAEEIDNEGVFATGHKVGILAQNYFGDYVNAEQFDAEGKQNISLMIEKTKEFMNGNANNIAEAAFVIDGLYCAVDILHRNMDGWDIVEVKSSTSVKNINKDDVAYQYYVLRLCNVNVKNVFLMHINNKYVRQGELDLKQLFVLEDLTEECKNKELQVKNNIELIRQYNNTTDEPVHCVGQHCETPYQCAFRKYCCGDLPNPSVFDLRATTTKEKYELFNCGIKSFEDILTKKPKLGTKTMQQVECFLKCQPDFIDKNAIKKFLNTLTYPIYHLDFETFQEAIPSYDGQRPYMQMPFQYSLHIEYEDGKLEHKEFIAKEGTDPRRAIAESLCRNIPMNVCCSAYNMNFEKGVLCDLANIFSDLAEHLLNISANMHDFMEPFSKRNYYTADMQGSYSIKYVLPALYPDDTELNYDNLEGVHNGAEASSIFANLADRTPEEIEKIRKELFKYCELDTLAMV
ncbi:MAG: DUF2779 domain-containing protein, partial [Phascolarctobacterium sp.]|nr:DUF2779 domain-containing protein [Candidatus Phascolarctobacterium caballi]